MKTISKFMIAACALLTASCAKKEIVENTALTKSAVQNEFNALASPVGDVVGKITVGYQGWFAASGDGSPINNWWHWTQNWGQSPSASNNAVVSWPDVREYTSTYATSWPNLGNGQQARLFSSFNDQTINTHFLWMQQNGIDCAALQRFNPNGQEGPVRDAITVKVKNAAEAYNVKFYIMYDVSNWTNMQTEIKTDWTNKMAAYTSSSAYARQNGKPVVCIWGFGFNDSARPFSAAASLDVINWFKNQGCYVIGGVPTHWRSGNEDSRPGFLNTYKAFDMLSPWMVGRIANVNDSDNFYTNVNTPDQAFCNANNIDYQPCVLPGDLKEHQRAHGNFMWRQFYNMIRVGAQGLYISMFDEYNEGNQIAKTAENASMVPAGSGFVTLDEDGTPCSADYYLRLTNDGGRMLKGQIALTAVRPTVPYPGGSNPGPAAPIGQTIFLKGNNSRYVCSENGTQAMQCNRLAVGPWEQFTIVDAGGGKIALKNGNNYVSSENGGQPINCNRLVIGAWEKFDWVSNANGSISLRGNNGRYVSSENGTQAMTCNKTTIQSTEEFRLN